KLFEIYTNEAIIPEKIEELAKLHLTSTMESQLNELIAYSKSIDVDLNDLLRTQIGDRLSLNKRESLEVIDYVKQYLIK
ncbi:MAG: hypothetical protein MJ094_07895, partial [Saccharofermentans sp.]|nr:hypothetical protein [Saccharofermentans sp.]